MRRSLSLALDFLIIALSLPLALFLRENLFLDAEKLSNHLPFLIATMIVALPALRLFTVDRTLWRYCTTVDHFKAAAAVGLMLVAATLLTFLYNRLDGISRSTPVLQWLLASGAMIVVRVLTRQRLGAPSAPKLFARVGGQQRHVLLIGLTSLAELYAKAISEHGDGRVKIAGILDYTNEHDGMLAQQLPVFSGRSIQDIVNEQAVHGIIVDRVVVTTPLARLDEATRRRLDAFAHISTIEIEYLGDTLGLAFSKGGEPEQAGHGHGAHGEGATFEFTEEQLAQIRGRRYWKIKRCADFALALVMILCLWPVAILVALAVASEIGLPLLFWQSRPGVCGHPFRLYKFRTMSAARDASGRLRSDDERLGPIGNFLRRTRLDELPQLWNILIGQMSFIGPRPLLPIDQAPGYSARLLVRPGLTGWGQIKGGRAISPADKAALDIWYVKNASFALDLEIIKGTIPMVLRGERVHHDAIDRAWQELRHTGT